MSVQQMTTMGDRLVHHTAQVPRVADETLLRKVIPYLKACAALPVVPAQALNLAQRLLRKVSVLSPLRPSLLLATARVLSQGGEVTSVIQCLEEFVRLRRVWRPEDAAAEPEACDLLARSLSRDHQHAAAVNWYDRAAILYLLDDQEHNTVSALHGAARCCLVAGNPDAGVFLDRMAALIDSQSDDAEDLAALVTAGRAWYWLNLGDWDAAMADACTVLERPDARAESRAQAAWVAGRVALTYGQPLMAAEFSMLTMHWAERAGWVPGLRLAGELWNATRACQQA